MARDQSSSPELWDAISDDNTPTPREGSPVEKPSIPHDDLDDPVQMPANKKRKLDRDEGEPVDALSEAVIWVRPSSIDAPIQKKTVLLSTVRRLQSYVVDFVGILVEDGTLMDGDHAFVLVEIKSREAMLEGTSPTDFFEAHTFQINKAKSQVLEQARFYFARPGARETVIVIAGAGNFWHWAEVRKEHTTAGAPAPGDEAEYEQPKVFPSDDSRFSEQPTAPLPRITPQWSERRCLGTEASSVEFSRLAESLSDAIDRALEN
jgi:hypothetical protein